MKNILSILVVAFLFSCHNNKKITLSPLPSFKMMLLDSSTIIKSQEIPTGKATIFLFFRPDCPHCQKETQMLLNHIDSLQKVQLYFLTIAPIKDIREFNNHFHLASYSNLTVAKDYEYTFVNAFHPSAVPYMAIYDGKKTLVKVYSEEPEFSSILRSIQM